MAEMVRARCDTHRPFTRREIFTTERAIMVPVVDTLGGRNDPQPFKVALVEAENTTVRRFFFAGAGGSGELFVPEMARSSGDGA